MSDRERAMTWALPVLSGLWLFSSHYSAFIESASQLVLLRIGNPLSSHYLLITSIVRSECNAALQEAEMAVPVENQMIKDRDSHEFTGFPESARCDYVGLRWL